MNRNRPAGGRARTGRQTSRRSDNKPSGRNSRSIQSRPPARKPGFSVVERSQNPDQVAAGAESVGSAAQGAFRVLIAVHRPRFRGRAERAAALVGWEVTALLNKQDPVGQVAKPPRPPDLLILSGDFGRQRDYAIFRAVQPWREQGMQLIGMVGDCETAPEGFPDSAPEGLCDVCITPPYTAGDLRRLFIQLYEEMRGEPAPPPLTAAAAEDDEADDV